MKDRKCMSNDHAQFASQRIHFFFHTIGLPIQKQQHANAESFRRERAPAAAVSRMHSCQHRGQQPLTQRAGHAGTQRRGRCRDGARQPRTQRSGWGLLRIVSSDSARQEKKNPGEFRFGALWLPASCFTMRFSPHCT